MTWRTAKRAAPERRVHRLAPERRVHRLAPERRVHRLGRVGAVRRTVRDERGQTLIEFVSIVPYLLLLFLFAFQAYIAVVASERVDNAARTGARVASMGGEGVSAAWNSLPDWMHDRGTQCPDGDRDSPAERTCVSVDRSGPGVRVTVRGHIPLFYPGSPLRFPIEASVTMPT